jgi:hypothetical protein
MNRNLLVALAAAIPCVACSSTVIEYAGRSQTPAHPASEVLVLACPPDRPYVELGVFAAHASSVMPIQRQDERLDDPDTLENLRAEAGARGCDAILSTEEANRTIGGCKATRFEGYRAACIAFQ